LKDALANRSRGRSPDGKSRIAGWVIATEFSADEYPPEIVDGFGKDEVKVIAPEVYAGATPNLNQRCHYLFK
jgi:hypothetical protein